MYFKLMQIGNENKFNTEIQYHHCKAQNKNIISRGEVKPSE